MAASEAPHIVIDPYQSNYNYGGLKNIEKIGLREQITLIEKSSHIALPELVNENKVSSIDVFTLNGQVLKTVKDNISQNSLAISFQEYPVGIYFLSLNYTNGDKKSIKIVKN